MLKIAEFPMFCFQPNVPIVVAHQAPLSMIFFRQEYWSGLPFPSPLFQQSNIKA